jgi:hypothetical protein
VFLAGWHVGVRGELIVGRLAPSWSVLPFAALAGRAAEHPVDPTAEAGKVGTLRPGARYAGGGVEHDEDAVVAADARKALVERTAAAADNQAGTAGVTAADEDVIKAAKRPAGVRLVRCGTSSG